MHTHENHSSGYQPNPGSLKVNLPARRPFEVPDLAQERTASPTNFFPHRPNQSSVGDTFVSPKLAPDQEPPTEPESQLRESNSLQFSLQAPGQPPPPLPWRHNAQPRVAIAQRSPTHVQDTAFISETFRDLYSHHGTKPPVSSENTASQTNQVQVQPKPITPQVHDFSHADLFSHAPQRRSIPNVIQAKLTVGAPNDVYEQEADRVAKQVMTTAPPTPPNVQRESEAEEAEDIQTKPLVETITPLVQRQEMLEDEEPVQTKCETCEQEEKVQCSANGVGQAQPDLESRLNASKGGGSPLPDEVRSFMEPRFKADFSQVRVHTGSDAVEMNRGLDAQAFTHKQDVYFGSGKAPGNDALTAHELTHVVQQTGILQRKCPACHEEDSQTMRKGTVNNSVYTSLTSNSTPTSESILQMQGLGIRGQYIQREEGSSTKNNNSAQLPIQAISEQKVMRSLAFDSTVQICRRALTTRKVRVSQGGLRVVLDLKPLNTEVPNCRKHDFGVTLTKSVDMWFDDEIATCTADTSGTKSFSFSSLPSGTYYLTISRTFDHPYCCIEGDIFVFDESISGDSSGCIRDKDPSAMDIVHGALDIAGFIPVLGAIPDGINAVIYVAEGDWANAGISAFAMIPAIGDGAKAGLMGGKAVVKVSAKTSFKLGEEGLAKAFKEAKAVSEAEAAAKAASKLEKEAAEKAAKEATEKAIQAKIKKCLEIYAAKEALGTCKGCKKTDTPAERAAKIACLTSEIAFRSQYLKEDCDDVLPGSLERKKKGQDPKKGHEIQLAEKIQSLAKCSTLPTQ